MFHTRFAVVALTLVLSSCAFGGGNGPSTDQFKSALNDELQSLRPDGFTERTVLFDKVVPAGSNGPKHSFIVTATIHDYGPGYPSNGYYGQTCVRKMDAWTFDMVPRGDGAWIVQGRMTVTDGECVNNTQEGQAAIALASLPGQTAAKVAPPVSTGAGSIVLGEYACYGTGGRLMAGMGFELDDDGSYVDLDGERGGDWEHDEASATIQFSGGFLDGQTGSDVSATGFTISNTVSCEPFN
ncbi:hypothetical protein [Ahniella affigens]|nr:hypothetical protein [Ahniella affigens]